MPWYIRILIYTVNVGIYVRYNIVRGRRQHWPNLLFSISYIYENTLQPSLSALGPVLGAPQGICDIPMSQEALRNKNTPSTLRSEVDVLQRGQHAEVNVRAMELHLYSDYVPAIKCENNIQLASY